MRWLLLAMLSGCVPDLAAAQKHLRSAIDAKEDDLASCYGAAVARDKDAAGVMKLVLHVVPDDGRVESVTVSASDLSDAKLEKCVKGTLVKVRVKPAPPSAFDIDYKLQFGEATEEDAPKKKPKKPVDDEDPNA